MTYTCRAIVGDSEYACPYWDCNLVIYARKHDPFPRALAEALCVTPNCIAMVTQNPSEAQDIDGMVMTQFNRETGLERFHSHSSTAFSASLTQLKGRFDKCHYFFQAGPIIF